MARWYDLAACIGMDTRLFFPPESPKGINTPGNGPDAFEARAACARCPVTRQCLAEALMTGDHGIRGGTSLLERNRMKRQQRRQAEDRAAKQRRLRSEAKADAIAHWKSGHYVKEIAE